MLARRAERHPRRAHRAAGLLAARLHRRPRRRLPGRVLHPRPRLGRARRARARDHGDDARVGPGDRRRQRLPGRHARGPGDPDRNKAADLGISMADIGDTINAAIGGQRVGKFKDKGRRFDIRVRLLAPAAPEARGHRAAAGAHAEAASWCASATSCASSSGRGSRPSPAATASGPSRSSRTSAPGASQGEAIRARSPLAREIAARRLPRRALGHQRRPSRNRSTPCASRSRWAHRGLHGARRAVQRVHAPVHGAAGASVQHQRRAPRALARRPEPEHLQHARSDPADGDREEELDPAGGLHEPDPRAGRRAPRGAPCRPARSACGRS